MTFTFEPIEYDWALDAQLKADKASAISWAQAILANPNGYAILDTETTNLANPCIIQLAYIDLKGNALCDILVKPKSPGLIGAEAFSKHGLSDEILDKAQGWRAVSKMALSDLDDLAYDAGVKAIQILAYGAAFDRRAISYTSELWGIPDNWPTHFDCVMNQYAKYLGNWNPYHNSYTWPKLPSGDHSALGDVKATLKVIETMANEN